MDPSLKLTAELDRRKELKALCHGQLYQKRIMRAYDKKVRPRQFQERDLVLKKILLNQQDQRGKWALNWDGPYVVEKAFTRGALILLEMNGNDLPNPIKSDRVKKYYA